MSKISNTQRRRKNKKFEQFRRKLKESQLNIKNAPRIGKPQKSNKHKKLKSVDPFYHGERKDKMFEGTDQKPMSLEQEIPKKSLELLELMKETKQMKKLSKKNKKKRKRDLPNVNDKFVNISVPDHPKTSEKNNKFRQKAGESDRRFIHRMNEESKKAMLMAKLAEKWDADVVETEDGEYKIKRDKQPSEKKKRREAQKKEIKRQKKEDKFIDQYQDFKTFEDHVEFGETVHAPPALTSLPRKANKESGSRKPGAKSMILKDILMSNKANNDNQKSTGARQVGKTLKRKLISPAQQILLDNERDRVIDVYRKMRDAKYKK